MCHLCFPEAQKGAKDGPEKYSGVVLVDSGKTPQKRLTDVDT